MVTTSGTPAPSVTEPSRSSARRPSRFQGCESLSGSYNSVAPGPANPRPVPLDRLGDPVGDLHPFPAAAVSAVSASDTDRPRSRTGPSTARTPVHGHEP